MIRKKYNFPPLVVLAGGRSSRFGSPKGLATVGGQSLISAHCASYLVGGNHLVLVTGFIDEPYRREWEICRGRHTDPSVRFEIVRNPRPDDGPFSSLQSGVASLTSNSESGLLIQPVDCGPVPPDIYRVLTLNSQSGASSVVPVFNGKGGHPVLISRDLVRSIAAISLDNPNARLDLLLKKQPPGYVVHVPVDCHHVLRNINSPNDQ